MHPGRAGRRTRDILRLNGVLADRADLAEALPEASKAERADRADRGGAAGRVGGENTHTGRILTVENAVSAKRALIFLRFGLQFCVCSQNTHTGGRKGRRETPKTRKNQAGKRIGAFSPPVLCVCLCV